MKSGESEREKVGGGGLVVRETTFKRGKRKTFLPCDFEGAQTVPAVQEFLREGEALRNGRRLRSGHSVVLHARMTGMLMLLLQRLQSSEV
jgi:hypothetical protein